MARNQKNLLEAFQRANDERVGGDPASAGPFAGGEPSRPARREPRSFLPNVSPRDARVIFALFGGAIAVFVLGLVIGRGLGPSVSRAAEPGADSGWVGVGGELEAGDAINDALDDPANRYTVLAFVGRDDPDDPEGLDRVWDAFDHLRASGVPVAMPVTYGGRAYVMVGASPTEEALKPLCEYLQGLPGADGRSYDYAEAYVLPVENLLSD
jgi:hypothetical protein